MIKINLLPYREKEQKEGLQRQIIIFSGVMVLFFLIILSVHLFFSLSVSGMEKKIREADARLIVLNKKVGDIEGFKKDKKELASYIKKTTDYLIDKRVFVKADADLPFKFVNELFQVCREGGADEASVVTSEDKSTKEVK